MQLFKAHAQWKSRPADERFSSLQDMHQAVSHYREIAVEARAPLASVRVEAQGDDLKLVGQKGQATLTHWSMGQISNRAKAPASYLRSLPATLAAQNLNHGLKANATEGDAQLLFADDNGLTLRALTTEVYSRIWNQDITQRLLRLQQENPNWKNPLAYKVIEPGKKGDWPTFSTEQVPSGLYASQHDMFAFLVDESKTLEGSPQGLNRGFFIWNSEVGAASFGIMTFLYDRVCGNNIVWGASGVSEFRLRHVGNAPDRAFGELRGELIRYSNASTSETEAMIESAKRFSLGSNKQEAFDNILNLIGKAKVTAELTQTRVKEALDIAERREDRYGSPTSLWAAVSGLTEASQFLKHADERVKVDRAACKLLKRIEF